MMFIADATIERFIKEDIPYIDLTSLVLNMAGQKGKMEYICREEAVICGTEEVLKIFHKLNITPLEYLASGTAVKPQSIIIGAEGKAEDLHMAWRVSLNVLEHVSGIATRTRRMVEKAREVNPNIEITATRKVFPGTKEMSTKAVIAGGGLPHRLGLSETILIFEQHLEFLGGLDGLLERLKDIKLRNREKKVVIEVKTIDDAVRVCQAGADGVQFDKISPLELRKAVEIIRGIDAGITILAAGGINESNVQTFAQTGVDALVTSAVYFGRPVDMGVKMSISS
ncbi:MAG: ModD protein [Syntrophomonas sp.]|nr:ModD protein [Syntrophomonas sp.]